MKKLVIILLLAFSYWHLAFSQIGTWKAYMAYHDVQQIQKAGDDLFVMASNDLYQYNLNDQTIYTYDKTNGMSDTYITHIKWCPSAKYLIVAYQNSNIDLVSIENDVINISDLYTKVITGDKTINHVTIHEQYAYLACGFGIVKLDVQNHEISESYMLNQNILNISIENNMLYAKTDDGVICGSMSKNLIDPNNWQKATTSPSFDDDNKDYNTYIETVKKLNPGGPKHNFFGFMKFHHNKLYTSNGDFQNSVPVQVMDMNNKDWNSYQYEGISQATGVSYQGAFCFDIDPNNDDHIFIGSRNGLYEFNNGKFVKFFNSDNSPIEAYDGSDKNFELVTGIKYDQEGNLWLLNSQAPTQALIKYSNGKFTSYPHAELMKLDDTGFKNKSNGELSKTIIDSNGLLWFVNNNWIKPAFYCYNPTTDKLKAYETFVNQDGTTINILDGVRYCIEDLDGSIWIATSSGPLLLTKDQMDSENPVLTQVKVPRNDGTDYADYLLAGIDITSIAIDGAGRKWFGTNGNGVYLISADNMEQVQHFTTTNSCLLSDIILSISINPSTGEVFFGTDKGLCSYVSDATKPSEEMTKDNVYAYPNPVDFNNYNGYITITGLTFNADVKIMSSYGTLVNEGHSNGGTYVWDGCDQKGKRVASGIYMVATATSNGEKGTVCKIAIVR